VERVHEDQVKPPSTHGISVNPTQEAALMTGMAVLQKNRYQNVPELYASLYGQPSGALATQISAPSVVTPGTGEPPPYVQERAQENLPPVFTPDSTPASEAKKPKRMTKEKWIIAIACGVLVGVLSFAFGMWQSSNNRADTPDRPSNSPPATERPAANDGITGTWDGILGGGDDSLIIELMLDISGKFYLLEYDYDKISFSALEGTYSISDSRLQMTFLWGSTIADWTDNNYVFYDFSNGFTETYFRIDADTLFLDSLGFGMADVDVTLTRGVSSGLWSFEHRERLEVQSPRDSTHVATVTLGDFQELGDMPNQEGGWWSDGVGVSPYTAQDFTDSRYLILEFNRKPYGEIDFAWIGDTNDWVWTVTSFTPQSRILIIDLAMINGYNQYIQASSLKIFICCYGDSWQDLIILDAYFANAR
jgi:hypothetical protein